LPQSVLTGEIKVFVEMHLFHSELTWYYIRKKKSAVCKFNNLLFRIPRCYWVKPL